MAKLLTAGMALVLVLGLGVLALAGCDSPAAQRERARAERIRAEALAYQQQVQADTQAAAERAATRQMERDASHQRALETLPYVVLVGGGVGVLALVVLAFWDLRRQSRPVATDPGLLVYLDRQRLERDRQLWRAIAHLDRRILPTGVGSPAGESTSDVIIYDERSARQ